MSELTRIEQIEIRLKRARTVFTTAEYEELREMITLFGSEMYVKGSEETIKKEMQEQESRDYSTKMCVDSKVKQSFANIKEDVENRKQVLQAEIEKLFNLK